MRFAVILLASALLSSTCVAEPGTPPTAVTSSSSPTADFTLDAKTTVPGAVLAPGRYTISVIDHLNDRMILQIADKKGKVRSTFLGLKNEMLPGSVQGALAWGGKLVALRGFTFPGSDSVEFVYPKEEAVVIAQGNTEKVLAIDPASDSLSFIHQKLSTQDMQIVTLWTLKSTRVGAEPAIEAARYQAPKTPSTSVASQSVANLAPEPVPSPSSRDRALAKQSNSSSTQNEALLRKPLINSLPHTASNTPLLMLCSALSLVGAALFATRRFYADAS